MTTNVDIERKRGDTKAIVFVVTDPITNLAIDIGIWSGFTLTVDPEKFPLDALNNEWQSTGALVTDGTDGKVRFFPPGTSLPGTYFYDAQALDNDVKKCTFAEGKYKLTQDITKD